MSGYEHIDEAEKNLRRFDEHATVAEAILTGSINVSESIISVGKEIVDTLLEIKQELRKRKKL